MRSGCGIPTQSAQTSIVRRADFFMGRSALPPWSSLFWDQFGVLKFPSQSIFITDSIEV
jgi:hypothetical protein